MHSTIHLFDKKGIIDETLRSIKFLLKPKLPPHHTPSSITESKKLNNNMNIADNTIGSIMEKISFFEQNKGYLNSGITLSIMAKLLETNSTYLSKVINSQKHKNFSNYINDLRIEYAIEQLKKDFKYRKYSISAIAHEVGFANSKTFSRAFMKKTGQAASFFIKKLE